MTLVARVIRHFSSSSYSFLLRLVGAWRYLSLVVHSRRIFRFFTFRLPGNSTSSFFFPSQKTLPYLRIVDTTLAVTQPNGLQAVLI